MPPRRARGKVTHLLTGDGDVVDVGGQCGLTIDLDSADDPPGMGTWIATAAGSRYLVDHALVVRARKPRPRVIRYRLRTFRLPKHAEPPADVRVIWLTWYPRGRSS